MLCRVDGLERHFSEWTDVYATAERRHLERGIEVAPSRAFPVIHSRVTLGTLQDFPTATTKAYVIHHMTLFSNVTLSTINSPLLIYPI
jgi:hypothetical protein